MEHKPFPPDATKPPESKFPWPLIALAVAVLLLIAWGRIPPPEEVRALRLPPDRLRIIEFLRWIPWMVLALALLIATEAFFVLRRFAREEAKRRAEQPPKPPQP